MDLPYTHTDGAGDSIKVESRAHGRAKITPRSPGSAGWIEVGRFAAPDLVRAILAAAGCDDILVLEGIGPPPVVVTNSSGDRVARISGREVRAGQAQTTDDLRQRTVLHLALYLDRLAADSALVLREDVREVLERSIQGGAYADVVKALAALPGMAQDPT